MFQAERLLDVSLVGDTALETQETALPLLLSAESLAGLLEVSKRTVWRLRSAGKLPRPIRVGSNLRWRAREIRAWIDAGCPTLVEWEAMQADK